MAETPDFLGSVRARLKQAETDTPVIRWSVLGIGLLAAVFWIIIPLHDWKDSLRQQIQVEAGQASRLIALKENKDLWLEAETKAQVALEQAVEDAFTTQSWTMAQGEVQILLIKLTEGRNLTIEQQRLLPPNPVPGLGDELAVAMNLRGNLADAMLFLDDISQHPRLIEPNRWFIRQTNEGEPVIMQIVVSGLHIEDVEGLTGDD